MRTFKSFAIHAISILDSEKWHIKMAIREQVALNPKLKDTLGYQSSQFRIVWIELKIQIMKLFT